MTLIQSFVPVEGKPGWRRHPVTGEEYFMETWRTAEGGAPRLALVQDLPPIPPDVSSKTKPGPTAHQLEVWQRRLSIDSLAATLRNVEKMLELAPPDREFWLELHAKLVAMIADANSTMPTSIRFET